MPYKDPDAKAAQQRRWRKANPEIMARITKKYGESHRSERLARGRRNVESYKESAINMYSNGNAVCAWCGQGDIDVLTLDHIDNDGAEHRRQINTGARQAGMSVYRWLRKHGYPPGFQVLCCNCNMKKHRLYIRSKWITC